MTTHLTIHGPETNGLADEERRALLRVWARTRQGKFASGLYDWTDKRWRTALSSLTDRGYAIEHVHGQVLHDRAVRGGWILTRARRPVKARR